MITHVTIDNIVKKDIAPNFQTTFINTKDGRSFSAHQNTPGYEYLSPNARVILKYSLYTKNGTVYKNVTEINKETSMDSTKYMTEILKAFEINTDIQNQLEVIANEIAEVKALLQTQKTNTNFNTSKSEEVKTNEQIAF